MIEPKPLILIVEDDRELAQLNARILSRKGYDTIVANSAAEARDLAAGNAPDLFVLDIQLPDSNGLALCRELRQQSDAPVLFLTGRKRAEDTVAGLETGGDYYMTKPFDRGEFVAVIQSLLRRAGQTRDKLAKAVREAINITKGPLTLSLSENKAFVNGRDAGLTQKEFAILLILVKNEGKKLTGEQLYKEVWKASMNSDSNAMRMLISRLKKKLGDEDTEGINILNEYGGGYRFTTV